ncbi:uncharacterized protein LOC129244419 [Anastrepha obliqua]|uniref:uncharacterized protein LOC129244419 n=1 Tax=Anastrepha obliqua TaxID=95512 RepID=UPI00240A95E7|nr:uncharacterized protein LOC129244419 [Anastrepha obliqua]
MGPFKKYYNDEIRRFMREQGRKVTHFDIVGLFTKAYLRVQTRQNGFKATGIYPFDKHIFTDADFIAGNSSSSEDPVETINSTTEETPGGSTMKFKQAQAEHSLLPGKYLHHQSYEILHLIGKAGKQRQLF